MVVVVVVVVIVVVSKSPYKLMVDWNSLVRLESAETISVHKGEESSFNF